MRAYVWILNENVTVKECIDYYLGYKKQTWNIIQSIASLFGELSDGETCVKNFILDQMIKMNLYTW